MALSHHDATTDRYANPTRGTLRDYFVRYRWALYPFLGSSYCFRCYPELELAKGCRVTPHRGIAALHVNDVHVHETREEITKLIEARC